MDNPDLIFSASPHAHTRRTTQGTMIHVIIALLPALGCSLWYFGLPALAVLAVSVVSCMTVEWAVTRFMLRRQSSLADCSALLTGILLAMNLPATLPLWMVAAGAVMAIGVAKMAFGGHGCNIFNPALVGRVFLLISFPAAMTTWPLPGADGATGPTLLSLTKTGAAEPSDIDLLPLLTGEMAGSMGEVCAVALIAGFLYLLCMGVIKWYIPVSIVAGLCAVDFAAGYPPLTDIMSGGLLLGAIFMATDYVTSPMTGRGMLIYGLLIGIITAVIRRWGAYPEGMSFAILVMNGFTPLINLYMKPVRFSPKRKEVAA